MLRFSTGRPRKGSFSGRGFGVNVLAMSRGGRCSRLELWSSSVMVTGHANGQQSSASYGPFCIAKNTDIASPRPAFTISQDIPPTVLKLACLVESRAQRVLKTNAFKSMTREKFDPVFPKHLNRCPLNLPWMMTLDHVQNFITIRSRVFLLPVPAHARRTK